MFLLSTYYNKGYSFVRNYSFRLCTSPLILIMSTSRCILLDNAHIGDQHITSFVDLIHLVLHDYEHIMLHTPRSCPHWRLAHPFLCRFDSLSTTWSWARQVAYSSIIPTLEIKTSLPSSIRFTWYYKIMSTSRRILLDHAHIEDQHIPFSHQTTVLWHDSRITTKITNKSLHRECWVHFMHSMTHALHDVEVVELSVLVVGIPHVSKPLIQLEDSIVWKSESSTSGHKYDVLLWKRSASPSISFCNLVQEYWESSDSDIISSWSAIVKTWAQSPDKMIIYGWFTHMKKMYCSTRIQ
jgi:hypothetical protein